MTKFNLGDRVTRLENVYDDKSKMMHGKISRVYDKDTIFGFYPELYEVIWDHKLTTWNNQLVRGGYLPHGLDHE